MKFLITTILILLVANLILCMFGNVYGGQMKLSRAAVVKLASDEATRLGYNVKSMNLKVAKHNTPWNEYLPREDKTTYNIERQNALQGKIYWSIYFSPNQMMLGGSLCVFIDSTSGAVITVMQWK